MSVLGIAPETIERLLWTLAVLVSAALLSLLVRRLAARGIRDDNLRYRLRKSSTYTIGIVSILLLLVIWTRGGASLATYLGIVSAGIAIALQDPLTNLAGWLFLIVRRPFVVGDRVAIGSMAGDVVDVRLFQFSLVEIGNWVAADQSTGRLIHIPNGTVFREPVANYTQGFNFIWDEVPVTVTFESNWARAKEMLLGIATEHSAMKSDEAAAEVRAAARRFLIQYQPLTPIVWTSVADNGVTLTLRYLCEPRRRRSVANDVWEAILRAFAMADDIDFAYPTQRFYDNRAEGKPDAGGRPD